MCWVVSKAENDCPLYLRSRLNSRHSGGTANRMDPQNISRHAHDKPQPHPLFMDNQYALWVAHTTGPKKRRKYINLRHHYSSHHANNGHIKISHVSSAGMLGDILTKPLRTEPFRMLTARLNVNPTTTYTARPRPHCDQGKGMIPMSCFCRFLDAMP